MRRSTPLLRVAVAVAAAAALVFGSTVSASAAPPEPPGLEESRAHLEELQVAPEGSGDGYDRDKFPHWSTVEGSCNARESVLERDGAGVEVGDDCYPTTGSWTSPYDGATWTEPSDIDIDHMVPLHEAWKSGADTWTTDERERFANDLEHAQLWAVTDNVNQEKSDQDPAEWQPSLQDVHCVYARAWIDVKHSWQLTTDDAEKSALSGMLDGC
ncbi:MAG: DUF1524 domain-containing protein [Streptosporangiales bacterium]|nr:DUF1524 domain-containing protein [Streptosporangiales bacterium]